MLPTQVKESLSEKYDIVCFENLADYNQDSSKVYQLFQKHRKEEFGPTQRLVFWCGSTPSDDMIRHIERAADVIDISRCFVMICGPIDVFTKSDLDLVRIDIEADALPPDSLINLDNFCPLPWFHLAVMTHGRAQACCVYKDSVGSAIDGTVESLFNGPPMQELRQQFIQGHRPSGCRSCWILEDSGIKSNRQWHLGYYEKKFFTESWMSDVKLRSLDFRPSNICNFRCRICSPVASSLVLAESLKYETDLKIKNDLKEISIKGRWFDDNPDFFQQIEDNLAHMVQIDFYGGEPFLLKQLPKLLTKAESMGVTHNIRLHFNTNGSIWPENMIECLKKFREVDIEISLDNIGRRFEIERGGSWSEIEKNISRFQNLGEPFRVSLTPTVNIQNVLYLSELLDWAGGKDLRIRLNYLDEPEYFSIDYLTDQAKALVIGRLSGCKHPEMANLITRIQNSPGSDGQEFVENMRRFDQRRKEDFRLSHGDIAEAMGYVL